MTYDLAGGALIGTLLGVMNITVLRLSVRRALCFQSGWRAVACFIGSYAVRYLIIGAVVIMLMNRHKVVMALTVLGVLAALTTVLAIIQQQTRARLASKAEVFKAGKLSENV